MIAIFSDRIELPDGSVLRGLTGDVANGGIVESGSNANGSWTKFADGTMVCRKTVPFSGNISSASGSFYTTTAIALGAWPQNFVGVPQRELTLEYTGGNHIAFLIAANGEALHTETSAGAARAADNASRTGASFNIDVVGKGRWKA